MNCRQPTGAVRRDYVEEAGARVCRADDGFQREEAI
jgi:hypothetical protein